MIFEQLARQPKQIIRNIQNEQLRSFFHHQLPYSPAYRALFHRHKIRFDRIRTVRDLAKIPFTTKEDIAPTIDQPSRPRGIILQPNEALIRRTAPKKLLGKMMMQKIFQRDIRPRLEWEYKPVHTHFTTGRTSLPTPFVYSKRDIEWLEETGRRAFKIAGASQDDVAVNCFPYAPHLAFWMAYHAFMTVGMTSLHTGGGKTMGTEKIINAIERIKANVITVIPGYAYHLLREAVKQGRDFSQLRYVIFGGERVSQGLRQKTRELLEKLGALDAKILTTYALTESKTAWMQCSEQSGYHLYPDMEVVEIIDENGNPVGENEPGEIVITGINWRGSVVVRYRTGDMTKGMVTDPCPHCGRTVPRIHPDIQRKSEIREFWLSNVKGQLLNLNTFYPLLSGMKGIEEWQVIIQKKPGEEFGLDEIVIKISEKEGFSFDAVKRDVEHHVRTECDITPIVIGVGLQQLLRDIGMETEMKEKRIIDIRQ